MMKIDEEDMKNKDLPIKSNFIDLRYVLLAPKIEYIIGRHDTVDHSNLLIQ